MDAFLSNDFAGPIYGLAVLVVGFSGVLWGRRRKLWLAIPIVTLAGLVGVVGAAVSVGAALHIVTVLRTASHYPAPGKMIDVGGYGLHVWCEGPRDAGPPVVWITGGRGEGLELFHLHKALRVNHRSCLLDRSGVGWSDIGRFPKTVESDVGEVSLALERSGEKGPFVLAGWSLGGLLAENVAARRPALVAGLVLMDATTPDILIYGRQTVCAPLIGMTRTAAVLTQIGLQDLTWRLVVAPKRSPKQVAALREVEPIQRAHDDRARTWGAFAGAMEAQCAQPFSLVRYAGALKSIPLSILIPDENYAEFSRVNRANYSNMSELQFRNMFEIQDYSKKSRIDLSDNAKIYFAPKGSGHDFTYTEAPFVIENVRSLLRRLPARGATS